MHILTWPLTRIDAWLNVITMYKLTVYTLSILAIISIIFGFMGVVPFGGVQLAFTLFVVLFVTQTANILIATFFKAVRNVESAYITALILFFIVFPITDVRGLIAVALLSFVAVALKYIVVSHGRHIFNPAALALVVMGFTPFAAGIWWVGSMYLLPFTLCAAFLMIRKMRRADVFFSCVIAATGTAIVYAFFKDLSVHAYVQQLFLSWPLIFFASYMLTEPITMPPRRKNRVIYGGIVGILSSWPFSIAGIYGTPELALVIGNLYSFSVSLKRRVLLTLISKTMIAKDTYEFSWKADTDSFTFLPGQYMEWTIPLGKTPPDLRGNRRYFTIASSPSEKDIKLAIRTVPESSKGSTYKQALLALTPGSTIAAGQLAGDFILPKDTSKKIICVAGGIGITPFRSMIQSLIDSGEKRDMVLFYSNTSAETVAYVPFLDDATTRMPLTVVHLLPQGQTMPTMSHIENGFLTTSLIEKYAPWYGEATVYLSGPSGMVDAYKKLLRSQGIQEKNIVTDYFPGFA